MWSICDICLGGLILFSATMSSLQCLPVLVVVPDYLIHCISVEDLLFTHYIWTVLLLYLDLQCESKKMIKLSSSRD